MERDSLSLTVPVSDIVMAALRQLKADNIGLDRDEAYLLARLERGKTDAEVTRELLAAIVETLELTY